MAGKGENKANLSLNLGWNWVELRLSLAIVQCWTELILPSLFCRLLTFLVKFYLWSSERVGFLSQTSAVVIAEVLMGGIGEQINKKWYKKQQGKNRICRSYCRNSCKRNWCWRTLFIMTHPATHPPRILAELIPNFSSVWAWTTASTMDRSW